MVNSTRTTLAAFALGSVVGAVGWACLQEGLAAPERRAGNVSDDITDRRPALGPDRQTLLGVLAAKFPLNPINNEADLVAVELDSSGVTVSIGGPDAAPNRANVTGVYDPATAPTLATGAGLLAGAILGDSDWFGPWVAEAVKRCDPGFEVVGVRTVSGSGTFEVRVHKAEANGLRVLSIFFRRLRSGS